MTDYCTKAEVKAQADITGTDWDTVIDAYITAASKAIDAYCNRPDGFAAAAAATIRYFVGTGKPYLYVDEFATASSLAVAVKDSVSEDEDEYDAWTVGAIGTTTDADVFPATGDWRRPDFNKTPYNMLIVGPNGDYSIFPSGNYLGLRGFPVEDNTGRGLPTVRVTARWGYATSAPEQIKQATIIQVCRWLKRGQSAWADSIGNPETGELDFVKALDPDVQFILRLGRFVRPAV